MELRFSVLEDLHRQNMITARQRDEVTARYHIACVALTQTLENREIQQPELKRTQRQYARRILQIPVDVVDALLNSRSGTFGVRLKVAKSEGQ